jgi:nucleoside-diphosphate-sugar epimerase
MTARILVTGGTGTLGRHVVSRLRDTGYDVRVLIRRTDEAKHDIEYVVGDLLKDEGIDAAVNAARIIVHCAGSAKNDDEATRNLVRAAAGAAAKHLIYISVVGADRIPIVSGVDRAMFGYFGYKLAAEPSWSPLCEISAGDACSPLSTDL